MAFPRRQFLHGAAASLGLSALPRLACAQLYPSRPITLVVQSLNRCTWNCHRGFARLRLRGQCLTFAPRARKPP
jgi:hypothetical protein